MSSNDPQVYPGEALAPTVPPPVTPVERVPSTAGDDAFTDSGTSPPIDGAKLLRDVARLLKKYVVFPSDYEVAAVTLWIAHTHAIDEFDSTPRLALLSPEKGSGKTRGLEVLNELVRRPLPAVNISPAALFREIDAVQPTVLVDEVDAIFGPKNADQNEDLRAILNAGHRRGGAVLRMPSPNAKRAVRFGIFAPVAMAGIGSLPDTILDRSVVVSMRRKAPGEEVAKFRHRPASAELAPAADALAAWVEQNAGAFGAVPNMPEGLSDRPADVWEPLIAVADVAGGEWPRFAREAAVRLVKAQKADDRSWGVTLLRDIRTVLHTLADGHVPSGSLVVGLVALEEAPWGDPWNNGKPLTMSGLADRLRPYGIRPKTVKLADGTSIKGYKRAAFQDAFDRYLPPEEEVPDEVTG